MAIHFNFDTPAEFAVAELARTRDAVRAGTAAGVTGAQRNDLVEDLTAAVGFALAAGCTRRGVADVLGLTEREPGELDYLVVRDGELA